jgi:hypothetical protein
MRENGCYQESYLGERIKVDGMGSTGLEYRLMSNFKKNGNKLLSLAKCGEFLQ